MGGDDKQCPYLNPPPPSPPGQLARQLIQLLPALAAGQPLKHLKLVNMTCVVYGGVEVYHLGLRQDMVWPPKVLGGQGPKD